jgi:formamidopyrimidine-DNA glycosylase
VPELPEVETVRRGLEPVMAGHVIARAEVRRPDLRWPLPPGLAARLSGARVTALRRRAKVLLLDLDGADTLLVHLGMSGRMLISGLAPGLFHHARPMPDKHDHVLFEMDGGAQVTFNDARRFGMIDLCATEALGAHRMLAGLGPEPLGNRFDGPYLATRLAGRASPVKALLLDQRVVAGLGNIYVCEALWRARIAPDTPAGALSDAAIERLVEAIRDVLREAIAAGGSSLRDYRQTDGTLGYFQHGFAVYGRAGEPCRAPGCHGTITRIVQAGRSSFLCPLCQKPPRKRRAGTTAQE